MMHTMDVPRLVACASIYFICLFHTTDSFPLLISSKQWKLCFVKLCAQSEQTTMYVRTTTTTTFVCRKVFVTWGEGERGYEGTKSFWKFYSEINRTVGAIYCKFSLTFTIKYITIPSLNAPIEEKGDESLCCNAPNLYSAYN